TQLNLGKRKKRKEQSVTFADVEGVSDAKAELLKIVSCLNNIDRKYRKLGSKLPKGVLLTARALATEAGVSFHAVAGTEFVELYVGMGAARVRELFEKARKSAPSIIFIDEIDAVGGQRGANNFNSEGDQTLNQVTINLNFFSSYIVLSIIKGAVWYLNLAK
ncbi:ATPase, partial [Tanacetum coccineum]